MSPLTDLIALMFLLLIATAAVAWWTLTAGERLERTREAREAREEREERDERPARPPRDNVSNDAVRGARAPCKQAPRDRAGVAPPGEAGVTVRPRERSGEDPFERFLDPERRHRDDPGR